MKQNMNPEEIQEHIQKRIEKIDSKIDVYENAVKSKYEKKYFKNTTLQNSTIYVNATTLMKLLSELVLNFPNIHKNVFGEHLLEECRNILVSYTKCYHTRENKITFINETLDNFEVLQTDIRICLELNLISKSKIFNLFELETKLKDDISNFKCSIEKSKNHGRL